MLYAAIPFLAGIIYSSSFGIPMALPFICSAVFAALTLFVSKNRVASHISLYLAIFFLGIVCYQNSVRLPPDHIRNLLSDEPGKVFLKGVIIDDPVTTATFYKSDKTTFTVSSEAVKEDAGWRKVSGQVRVDSYADTAAPFSAGDSVMLEGLIMGPVSLKNPGLFDYSRYLGIKGIYAFLKVGKGCLVKIADRASPGLAAKPAYKLRNWIRGSIERYFPAYYGGFLKAILIGDRSDLGYALKDDFIKTGTVHILAISGLHVGLIGAIVMAVFAALRVPKKTNLILSALVLIFYSFVAGSSPPIVRATIIFSVFVIGYLMGRESDMLNSLSLAGILILLWNPKELFDPGFQLSFVSVASIVIFSPGIDALFKIGLIKKASPGSRARIYILKGVSVSIAAWLGTWPFIASYFNIISPVSVIANLVVIPMLFALMSLLLLFLAAGAISCFFASLAAYILRLAEDALFCANHYFSVLPFAYFRTCAPSAVFTVLYYISIFLFIMPDMIGLGRMKIRRAKVLLAVLVFFNILAWKDACPAARANLNMTFLDVGQGDSLFVELPGSGNILIDAGSGGEEERFDTGRFVVAPYLWNKRVSMIDAVIVTHFHEDHLGGIIYILKNFNVKCVIDNGAARPGEKLYDEYLRTIKEKNIRRLTVGEGDEIGPFNRVKFFVLNPRENIPDTGQKSDDNDNSIVMKLVYKNFSALLCADITAQPMARLTESYGKFLKSDVMKVPHHGGSFGDGDEVKKFFQAVSPEISIISVARSNRYRAPSGKTLRIINALNSKCCETKRYGAVVISSNGNGFKISTTSNKN